MSSMFAMASYRPHPGKEEELLNILREHVAVQRREGFATDHPVTLMKAEDGTLIEIFEWKSIEAKDQAHKSEAVMGLWNHMMEIAEMVPLATLAETQHPFAAFTPLRGIAE
jgi:hypothetical protein